MSKPKDRKGPRETGTHRGAKLDRAGRILDRFRRKKPQGAEVVQGDATRPPIVARFEKRFARTRGSPRRPVATTLCIVLQSLREAFDAYRHYEQLRSKGVPHDTAIGEALGISRNLP